MATARSIASLTLSFGLVNIPVLAIAAESGSIRFNCWRRTAASAWPVT